MSTAFVLDCSATLPWIFADEATPDTENLLNDMTAGTAAWVPSLWHLELANSLLSAQRKRRIDPAGIEAFFSQLAAYVINVDEETMSRAWNKSIELASQHQLSVYDATYLELALRKNLPLATLDKALVAAAQSTGVPLCFP